LDSKKSNVVEEEIVDTYASNNKKESSKTFNQKQSDVINENESQTNKNSVDIDKLVKELQVSNKNMETLMSIIANQNVGGQVASAFKNAQFNFDFQTDKSGVLTMKS
jgi:hypothetical protein